MLWDIYFWLFAALLAFPLPFKLVGYLNGTDQSPTIVKIEEIANALFFAVGLIGLYGYLNDVRFATPTLWRVWLILAVVWSLSALVWSPKLKYAAATIGKKATVVLALVSTALVTPLLIAIYLYASNMTTRQGLAP